MGDLRAGIVVTGNEVLNGLIADRNGPWLSERLRELGVEVAEITVVADRDEDLRAALEHYRSRGYSLLITTGGLGPTADDLTMKVVASFAGRQMLFDSALEAAIDEALRPWVERNPAINLDALARGTRKQATVPSESEILAPIGTAPGAVIGLENAVVVVLPGPPAELQPMWSTAVQSDALSQLFTASESYSLAIVRMSGIPESEIAETLRVIEADGVAIADLEITTCLRRGELEIATRFTSGELEIYQRFQEALVARHGDHIFSTDGRTIDEIVAALLGGHSLAVVESCTGGLLAGRITELAGASEYFKGGIVAYSNAAKADLAGVEPVLIEMFGAVSTEVASLLADGAIDRLDAEYGVGITGIAGPGGGTEEKPVGLVCISVACRDGRRMTRALNIPGDRASVRDRACTAAMQLLRRMLLGESDSAH